MLPSLNRVTVPVDVESWGAGDPGAPQEILHHLIAPASCVSSSDVVLGRLGHVPLPATLLHTAYFEAHRTMRQSLLLTLVNLAVSPLFSRQFHGITFFRNYAPTPTTICGCKTHNMSRVATTPKRGHIEPLPLTLFASPVQQPTFADHYQHEQQAEFRVYTFSKHNRTCHAR